MARPLLALLALLASADASSAPAADGTALVPHTQLCDCKPGHQAVNVHAEGGCECAPVWLLKALGPNATALQHNVTDQWWKYWVWDDVVKEAKKHFRKLLRDLGKNNALADVVNCLGNTGLDSLPTMIQEILIDASNGKTPGIAQLAAVLQHWLPDWSNKHMEKVFDILNAGLHTLTNSKRGMDPYTMVRVGLNTARNLIRNEIAAAGNSPAKCGLQYMVLPLLEYTKVPTALWNFWVNLAQGLIEQVENFFNDLPIGNILKVMLDIMESRGGLGEKNLATVMDPEDPCVDEGTKEYCAAVVENKQCATSNKEIKKDNWDYCRRSCSRCVARGDEDKCMDKVTGPDGQHTKCEEWRRWGECSVNTKDMQTKNLYMEQNCPKTCGKCVDPNDECVDYEKDDEGKTECEDWAKADGCSDNPEYMYEYCRRSCMACDGHIAKCLNNRPECGEWAKEGECDKNPDFMKEQCMYSCKVCEEKTSAWEMAFLEAKGELYSESPDVVRAQRVSAGVSAMGNVRKFGRPSPPPAGPPPVAPNWIGHPDNKTEPETHSSLLAAEEHQHAVVRMLQHDPALPLSLRHIPNRPKPRDQMVLAQDVKPLFNLRDILVPKGIADLLKQQVTLLTDSKCYETMRELTRNAGAKNARDRSRLSDQAPKPWKSHEGTCREKQNPPGPMGPHHSPACPCHVAGTFCLAKTAENRTDYCVSAAAGNIEVTRDVTAHGVQFLAISVLNQAHVKIVKLISEPIAKLYLAINRLLAQLADAIAGLIPEVGAALAALTTLTLSLFDHGVGTWILTQIVTKILDAEGEKIRKWMLGEIPTWTADILKATHSHYGAYEKNICSEECGRMNGNGVCNDGGDKAEDDICDYGTDCKDCGKRAPVRENTDLDPLKDAIGAVAKYGLQASMPDLQKQLDACDNTLDEAFGMYATTAGCKDGTGPQNCAKAKKEEGMHMDMDMLTAAAHLEDST